MKIVVLIAALLVGFCFACKTVAVQRTLLVQRQQWLAGPTMHEAPVQPQATATV